MKTLLPSLALLIAIPRLVSAQTTVFSDNMATSTVNQAPVAPTATSTSYEFLSGLAGGASTISPGALHLELPSTTSVLGEAQARFSSSPVALATAGDFINLTVTFLNTSNIMLAGNNNSSLVLGLYNSGGALPRRPTAPVRRTRTCCSTMPAARRLSIARRALRSAANQLPPRLSASRPVRLIPWITELPLIAPLR